MNRRIALLVGAVVAVALLEDEETSEIELPTTCRECDENERTFNTFRCPECHSEMTPDDHPPLATEYDAA